MVLYQCPRCHYDTEKKDNMRRHYNRKRKCKNLFSRKSVGECLEDIDRIKQLEERIKQLEYCTLMTNVTNNITNIVNNTTNQTINIHINDFKNTNYEIALDELKESIKRSLLKNDGECNNIECNQLVELVHCNDKYPENHNVLITDCSRGEARIKEGDRFIKVPMIDAVDDIVTNIINLLKENNVFKRYVKIYERKYRDDSFKEIRDTLYNNRQKIKETAKENKVKI